MLLSRKEQEFLVVFKVNYSVSISEEHLVRYFFYAARWNPMD